LPGCTPLPRHSRIDAEVGRKGCIDRDRNGRCGSRDYRGELRLAFIYWASFDTDGNLIKGQCVHPIPGGRGAFVGARGKLNMVDRPVGDRVKTTYRGEIILNAVLSEVPRRQRRLPPRRSARRRR
jgi:hypothetical protein